MGSIPGWGRSPGGGHDTPRQYPCLENPHGQRSLVGYSPWDRKGSDMTGVTQHTYNCFTMLCQFLPYNEVNPLYTYIHIPIQIYTSSPSGASLLPLQVITEHRAELPGLFGCFSLAISHMGVCICQSPPPSSSPSPPAPRPYVWTIPAPELGSSVPFSQIFLGYTHISLYTLVFLFLTYFTLYNRLAPSTFLKMTQFCSFF